MREITKIFNVYNYNELSKEAKEKVHQWYLDDPSRAQSFQEIYTDDLNYMFPNSDLKMQFSLSYCQGDGLNIYGQLDIADVFKVISDKSWCKDLFADFTERITEHEQKTIEAYMEVCGRNIELPYNNSHYSYCVSQHTDFADEWIAELEYQQYRDVQVNTILKIEQLIADIFTRLAKTYEKYGYAYFYEADADEIAEACECNEWEFLEDGTFYIE